MDNTSEFISEFLKAYCYPAFGALPKAEIDMLVLKLMEQTGRIKINEELTIHALSKELKISQAKAKNLLYSWGLRKYSKEKLREMTEKLLSDPKDIIAQKDKDEWFLFHVEDPYLIEHIRNEIHRLGYISDGSFSKYIIKLPIRAFVALIEEYAITNKDEILKEFGISEEDLKDVIIAILKDSVETLTEQFTGKPISLLVNRFLDNLPKLWKAISKIRKKQNSFHLTKGDTK